MTVKPLALAVIALALGSIAATARADAGHAGHGAARAYDATKVEATAYGQEGDPRKATRTITVDMTDNMRFSPADLTVRKGETVRFLVRNQGQVLHEMVLGTREDLAKHAEAMRKFPGMEHEDSNMAHVKPGADGQIVWQFTRAGEFQFACLQPGHFEAGMVGKVVVR